MLTKTDKNDIAEIIGKAIAENNKILADTFATKDELKTEIDGLRTELKDEMSKNKSEILEHIDAFAKEINDNRTERTVQSKHISDNTKRIEKLESRVFS